MAVFPKSPRDRVGGGHPAGLSVQTESLGGTQILFNMVPVSLEAAVLSTLSIF